MAAPTNDPLKPIAAFTGDGIVTQYTVVFKLPDTHNLEIRFDQVIMPNSGASAYTVVTGSSGTTITFAQAPAAGVDIEIRRVTPLQRQINYQDNGDLLAETLNKDFDTLWLSMQEQRVASDGSLNRPVGAKNWDAAGQPIFNAAPDPAADDNSVVVNSQLKTAQFSLNNILQQAAGAAQTATETRTFVTTARGEAEGFATRARTAATEAEDSARRALASEGKAKLSADAADASAKSILGAEKTCTDAAASAKADALALASANPNKGLVKDQNLADLPDKAAAIANLFGSSSTGTATSTAIPITAGGTGATTRNGIINTLFGSTPLDITEGGTGATSASSARAAILESNPLSVGEGGTGETTLDDLRVSLIGATPFEIAEGGTGADTAAAALANLIDNKPLPLPVAPAGDGDAATKKYVDDAVAGAGGAGGYIGETFWHPTRSNLPGGTITADGQVISAAKATYPDLIAEIVADHLPDVTETLWQSDPGNRGCYVYDAAADTLRVPDLNGVQPGSFPAPFLRGGSLQSVSGHMTENGAPNITGKLGRRDYQLSGTAEGALINDQGNGNNDSDAYNGGASKSGFSFDASRSSPAYGRDGTTEVRPNYVSGCMVIRVATHAQSGGTVDMLALQADIAALKAAAEATNNDIGYALLTSTNDAVLLAPALGSRSVLVNPFGIDTPVLCQAEIYHATLQKWIVSPWFSSGTASASFGLAVAAHQGEGIILKTGKSGYIAANPYSGSSVEMVGTGNYTTPSPVRIHVWSIGKDISKLKKMSEIDPKLVAEFKAPARPTGVHEVWHTTTAEPGGVGKDFTMTESVLGKKLYICISAAAKWYLTLDVPAVPLPYSVNSTAAVANGVPPGYFLALICTSGWDYQIAIAPDGMTLRLASATANANGIANIYVDDYTPQP